jgi:hypothetical protein
MGDPTWMIIDWTLLINVRKRVGAACRTTIALTAMLCAYSVPAAAGCYDWTSYKGIDLRRFPESKVYAYQTDRIAIDADGAPNAYHPMDTGTDALVNAGFPDSYWTSVLVTDPDDPAAPLIQRTGEFAGYYLSMTALEDEKKNAADPARAVDARKVPYIVFPSRFFAMDGVGRLGTLGMARNLATGQTSPMIVADIGRPEHYLGEISIKLAENLGGHNVDPRDGNGAPEGPFAYVIFPGSEATPPWPVSADELKRSANAELAKIGGWDAVLSCIGHD